jgi:multicomponent Na+:H+ antiporter subunit D
VSFAGDLITLFIWWEMMAIFSTIVVWCGGTEAARRAGIRYAMMHILSGVLLKIGIEGVYVHTGSLEIQAMLATDLDRWLILAGILINAAAPPFSSWLPDAYPETSPTGAVFLSAFTTKTAVLALILLFPGEKLLIWIGLYMVFYGIIYALLENDARRILAYSIINQVGFMVCAVGIGVPMALDGAVAHAFCHIIYKSLLWMSAGAVIYRVGMSKCTDLGGLYKSMPWSLWLGCIGALAISAVPLTSGFTSKTLILQAAAYEHLMWPWLILEIASAGVFLHAGIKFPYFVFFAKDRGHRVEEAPRSMIAGMAILAFLCIFLGVFPKPLYSILPNAEAVSAFSVTIDGHEFSAWKFSKVVTQFQLLLLSALTFFVWIKFLKRTDTIVLDTDWFYRRGGKAFYRLVDHPLNATNEFVHRHCVGGVVAKVNRFFNAAPARLLVLVMTPYWKLQGASADTIDERQRELYEKTRLGSFPVGVTAFVAVVLLASLFFF